MKIMQNAVTKIALNNYFHNQTVRLSDYYQIEVTYSRTEDDIVLMVYVPCIKTISLLKIYRYLNFPILIPFKTKDHDFTIKQSLNFQDHRRLKSNSDELFNQDHLDHR